MINAGLRILAVDGTQSYNSSTKIWSNVLVIVNYPTGQNLTNNPISVDDLIIEPFGNVWKVVTVTLTDAATKKFNVSLTSVLNTPSEEVSPNFGVSVRCGVVTPNGGLVAPYWDLSLVTDNVGRIATLYNNKIKIGVEALPLGEPGGVVGLDETGKIPVNTLPIGGPGGIVGLDETGKFSTSMLPTAVPLIDTVTGKLPVEIIDTTGIGGDTSVLEGKLSTTYAAIKTSNQAIVTYVANKLVNE